jgi:hypothetical protein
MERIFPSLRTIARNAQLCTTVDEGAEALLQFTRAVDLDSVGQPSFFAVLTGADVFAARRSDGIDVIPIAALGP